MLQNHLLRKLRHHNRNPVGKNNSSLGVLETLLRGSPRKRSLASYCFRESFELKKPADRWETKFADFKIQFARNYGTRSNMTFSSEHAANQFVRWLLPEERSALLEALKEYEHENESIGTFQDVDVSPTFKQLRLVALSNAIPFVGFGFLDNAIMILAGEYIDHTVGITLGISTMAAAAVGNLISDLMGLGLAGYVEAIAIKFGFDVPPLSSRQASMWKTKYSAYLGRGIGIAVGCVIGMFPLLFIEEIEERDTPKEDVNAKDVENEVRNWNSSER